MNKISVDEDILTFSYGKTIYANNGIIGIDDTGSVYGGYGGCILDNRYDFCEKTLTIDERK